MTNLVLHNFFSKKFFILISLCCIFLFSLVAQEAQSKPEQKSLDTSENAVREKLPCENLSFGTFALLQSRKNGGGLTFAFPIFTAKSGFFIRDEVMLSLYLANDFGTGGMELALGDKLHFGCLRTIGDFSFRTYGYMKCEIGPSRDYSYQFFAAPWIVEMGGAGGFEFIFKKNQGFFVEFGGGCAISSFGGTAHLDREQIANANFCGGYTCLTTGFKHYF